MATEVNKIYFTLSAAIPGTLGTLAADSTTVAFTATEAVVGTSTTSEKYGRFLSKKSALAAGDPANQRAENEVTAWFQVGVATTVGLAPARQSSAHVAIDFIAATGVVATLASIDPVLTRNFRIRAVIDRLVTLSESPRTTVNGTIYIQRQHSIEI